VALIERTIYPRFNKVISKNELIRYYTPYDEDINLAYKYVICKRAFGI
jgi:DNA primase